MKWLNEVLVYEVVPASRLNFTWGFKRKFRVGVNGTRRFAALDGRWKACETFFKYTIGEFLRASRMLLLSMFLLRPELLIVVVDCMVTSTGLFLGLLGVDYHEYKTIHGA